MTNSEKLLWSRLRGRQILDVQFYRQKPIGNYIVDFYAPQAKLVLEVDGSQHMDERHTRQDAQRDAYMEAQGLLVLRFDNLQVLRQIDAVMVAIFRTIQQRLRANPPSVPPFSKGGRFAP